MLQLFPVVRIVSLLGTKSLRNAPCDYAGKYAVSLKKEREVMSRSTVVAIHLKWKEEGC